MALFPTNHTLTQGSLHYRLATLGYQKRNTYGVETFISYHDSHFFAPEFMVDYAEKRRFYANIPMNVFDIINALMMQRRRCCSFDSPGLARNEPTPGKRSQGDSTP